MNNTGETRGGTTNHTNMWFTNWLLFWILVCQIMLVMWVFTNG